MVVAAKYTVALSLACVGCVLWRSETPFGDSPSLPSILLSERTVRDWLSRVDKDAKEARNKRIFDMWLACYTGVEIAEANNLSEKEVGKIVSDLSAELPKGQKADSEHATDFTPPIYNIWKQQEKTNGSSHFGNSEFRSGDNASGTPHKTHRLKAPMGHSEILPEARCLLRTPFASNFNHLGGILAINQLIKSLNRNVFVGRMRRVEISRGSQEQIKDSDLQFFLLDKRKLR